MAPPTNAPSQPNPHVVVLAGAAGDLARRKLLPGLYRLFKAGRLTACRIVGTSIEDLDTAMFVAVAHTSCEAYAADAFDAATWDRFAPLLKPGGLLFAGHSENASLVNQTFKPLGHTVYELARGAAAKAVPA